MKPEELRIGNWVSFNDLYCKIVGIDKDRVLIEYHNGETDYRHIDYIEPIELTEEVLVKIGFEKKNDCYILSNECIFFVYYKDSFKQELLASVKREGKYYYNTNELKNYGIKCLHQLQNAYYIATGKELKIEI